MQTGEACQVMHEALLWHDADGDTCSPFVHEELEGAYPWYNGILRGRDLDIWMTPLSVVPDPDSYGKLPRVQAVIRELLTEPTVACRVCKGEQEVVSEGAASGFAGGRVYWTQLACGHSEVDESDDVRAAR